MAPQPPSACSPESLWAVDRWGVLWQVNTANGIASAVIALSELNDDVLHQLKREVDTAWMRMKMGSQDEQSLRRPEEINTRRPIHAQGTYGTSPRKRNEPIAQ